VLTKVKSRSMIMKFSSRSPETQKTRVAFSLRNRGDRNRNRT